MTRPVFRVGLAGLDPRDARLIEIVFRHGQYNRYDFQLLDVLDMTQLDILIVNPVDPEGLDVLASARAYSRRIPVVNAVPRGSQIAARHSVTIDRLTLQLLPILNRVVREEGLQGQEDEPRELSEVLTEIHAEAGAVPDAGRASGARIGRGGGNGSGGNGHGAALGTGSEPDSASSHGPGSGSVSVDEDAVELSIDQALALDGNGVTVASAAVGQPAGDDPELAANRIEDAVVAALGGASNGLTVSRGRVERVARPQTRPSPELLALAGAAAWAAVPGFDPKPAAPATPLLQALVVDPSAAARVLLTEELQRLGIGVRSVATATAAAQCLVMQHFDLVVTEQGLADAPGMTLVHWMRRRPEYRNTPVILLQVRAGWFDRARSSLDRQLTVLSKPVTRRRLARTVRLGLRHAWVVDDFSAGFD